MIGRFYIYKTTNNINCKIYIGMHYSEDIENDTYMGSGKYIKKAIRKYGIKNFSREILFEYDNSIDASNKERELVNEDGILIEELVYTNKSSAVYKRKV